MTNLKSAIYLLAILFATTVAQAAESGTGTEKLTPKSELRFSKEVLDGISIDQINCTGSVIHEMPVLGKCPDIPGYVTIGFPTCTQNFEIPRKFTLQELSGGFVRLVCELDYTNGTAIGSPSCDYSRCMYVEEPKFP